MSSFSMVLLEEGVEMELPISMSAFISMLDGLVPHFTCEGHEWGATGIWRLIWLTRKLRKYCLRQSGG